MMNGDFTPLHRARVEFTSLTLPDGRQLTIHTVESLGLNSVVDLKPPKKKKPNAQPPASTGGVLGTARHRAANRKGPDRRPDQRAQQGHVGHCARAQQEGKLEEFLIAKLPYHRQ